MHIVDVKLENIKSHRNSSFNFERGTTAIVGENGAGKTTIIEAVAWALFDLLDYKKDDFVRRGEKKGSVQVTFESGTDERRYTVYRDTGTGYNIFDPELGVKVADKKEDVGRFLREHLGVEPGTDLELLFRSAIGVPQGTFTAIFLDTAARRKEAFDKLLKVEEYRQSSEKLRATSRYVENQVMNVREKIAHSEGELANFDRIEAEHKDIALQLDALDRALSELKLESDKKRSQLQQFDKEESAVRDAQAALDKLRAELATSEVLLKQKQGEVDTAREAVKKIGTVEDDHQRHLAALAELKTLEKQRGERDKILAELKTVETAAIKMEAEQKNLRAALERSENAANEIKVLEPQIEQQKKIETKREYLRGKLSDAKAYKAQIGSIEAKLIVLRDDFKKTEADVKEAQEKSRAAAEVEALSTRDTEITRRIAQLQAKLESDERFQREIKNGLCPILTEKCLNLKEGQTLEAFVSSQFDETRAEIGVAENEQVKIAVSLKTAREAEQFLKALETLQKRHEEVKALGLKLGTDKKSAEKRADELPKFEAELDEAEKLLAELKDPRGRVEALAREAEGIAAVKEKAGSNESELAVSNDKKMSLSQTLEKFAGFEQDWTKFSDQRDSTAGAHREYLTNELSAKALPEREKELENLTGDFDKISTGAQSAEQQFNETAKNYDREKHTLVRAELLSLEKELAETNARLSLTKNRQGELEKELGRLSEVRMVMRAEYLEKDRLDKIGEVTKFIRDTLKEAAPRVAKLRIYQVSNEANQIFREITGNPERSLKWTEDYGLVLEEGGYERPFQSLSGGEQMAAALSIRLALLKQLSDVRLAFFDEPTTNMDAERRQNLAEQISQITEKHTFDQLFVISHDDTFEDYVNNIVKVGDNEENIEKAVAA
ncbi:MAG TPA: SMC family ATPase [Pyrinomonadaceae bacterium]|jgi:exonuclease SbcC|nr:SMC family ATPase [Pyrinomonadaceae bacterium]